jgi:hypothetical protein
VINTFLFNINLIASKSSHIYSLAEAHFAPKNTLLLGTLCFSRAEHILQPKTLCKVTNYFLAHLGP